MAETGLVGLILFLGRKGAKRRTERVCKSTKNKLFYLARPSGGMADAGDLKSPARKGRMGSNPISAIIVPCSVGLTAPA